MKKIYTILFFLCMGGFKGNIYCTEENITEEEATAKFHTVMIQAYESDEAQNEEVQTTLGLLGLSYLKAERHNNPHHQYKLGKLFLEGNEFVSRDDKLSFYFLNKAVNNHYPQAYALLASLYMNDFQDVSKGLELALLGAEAYDPEAFVVLGNYYSSEENSNFDNTKAFNYYLKAANLGLARVYPVIGKMHEEGVGTSVDIIKAIKWYEKGAEQENASAYALLGQCYISGQGIEKDVDKGLKLLEKSADAGFDIAALILARYYLEGDIVLQDLDEAEKWATHPLAISHSYTTELMEKIHTLKHA